MNLKAKVMEAFGETKAAGNKLIYGLIVTMAILGMVFMVMSIVSYLS